MKQRKSNGRTQNDAELLETQARYIFYQTRKGGVIMGSNFFNNRQLPAQQRRVKNRRDADKLIHSSYTAFLLLGTMALHDQFGFGGARLGKWIDKMNELKECYEKGLVTVQDLQSMIKNETGIEIKF